MMYRRPIIAVSLLVIGLWAAAPLVLSRLYGSAERTVTLGDAFNAINALFAGLAFVALIYALLLQSKELSLQRKELALTRNELLGQKEQMQRQNETLAKQAFENTFFQLLRTHQDIVGSLNIRGPSADADAITTGRDCFVVYYEHLKARYEEETSSSSRPQPEQTLEAAYMRFYEGHHTDIGHYFRSLYNLIKFVHNSEIPNGRKCFYSNIVRAQLSPQEILLLFYNCISPLGRGKFRPLVETYALLKGLPVHQLLDREHTVYYNFAAYGSGAAARPPTVSPGG